MNPVLVAEPVPVVVLLGLGLVYLVDQLVVELAHVLTVLHGRQAGLGHGYLLRVELSDELGRHRESNVRMGEYNDGWEILWVSISKSELYLLFAAANYHSLMFHKITDSNELNARLEYVRNFGSECLDKVKGI